VARSTSETEAMMLSELNNTGMSSGAKKRARGGNHLRKV